MAECVKEKWVLEELFEREEVRQIYEEQAKEAEEWLKEVVERIRKELAPYEAKEYARWVVFHCPFHPPDDSPSFAFNKEKYYFVDFHDDRVYSLKDLAEKLGIELPRREKEEFDFEIVGSDGLTFPASGFFYTEGDDFIVTEYTQLWVRSKGKKRKKGKKKGLATKEHLKSFLVVNRNAERSILPLPEGRLKLNDRIVELKFGDRLEQPLPTLMSHKAVERFLNGEEAEFKRAYEIVKTSLGRFVNFKDGMSEDKAVLRVLESYFVDFIGSTAIVLFHGLSGSGKTRANMAITLMSRKGLVALNPSDASIFRIAEAINPTIGIDEEFTATVKLVLKGGYKRGAGVSRMEKKGERFVVRFYNPFTCYNLSLRDIKGFDEQLKRRLDIICLLYTSPSPRDRG